MLATKCSEKVKKRNPTYFSFHLFWEDFVIKRCYCLLNSLFCHLIWPSARRQFSSQKGHIFLQFSSTHQFAGKRIMLYIFSFFKTSRNFAIWRFTTCYCAGHCVSWFLTNFCNVTNQFSFQLHDLVYRDQSI